MPEDSSGRLVAALVGQMAATPAGHRSGMTPVVLETHLSRVILAGEDAWKIKKGVAFDFVDFSTLERRRLACEEELRLNRRYSPSLYLGVVPIVGTYEVPRIVTGGSRGMSQAPDERPIEYAVHMRRFPQRAIFSTMIAEGRLDPASVDALAAHVAGLHGAAARTVRDAIPTPALAPPDAGSPVVVRRQVMQALDGVAESLGETRVAPIRERLGHVLDGSLLVLQTRCLQGFVRECHADLHLSNICLHEGEVAVFDCLEFDPLLRVIDVMADLAFIVADLLAWRREDLAFRLLDRYLSLTGDHAGLRVLRLYVAYRALVRARVGLLSAPPREPTASTDRPTVDAYVEVARTILAPARPTLAILHGLSGSGKSWLAERLGERCGLIRLRSDVERKRLLGLPALAPTGAMAQDPYSVAHSQSTYAQLAARAANVIGAGYSVIVDATFQRRADRRRFADLARSLGARFLIIDVRANDKVMRTRIRDRLEAGTDPSEADEQVLELQHAADEPLDLDERRASVDFENSMHREAAALDAALAPIVERLAPEPGSGG